MPDAQIVERAQLTPGKCFLSGDFNGPFIDTGVEFRGYGRVYLALKHLGGYMRKAGWLPADELAEEAAYAEASLREIRDIEDRAELADALVAAITPLLPAPAPVVKQVAVPDPDQDRQIRALLRDVERLTTRLEAAYAESAERAKTPTTEAPPAGEDPEGSGDPQPGEATTVEVNGQTVNVDELLDRNAKDVVAVAESWDVTARYVVALREEELAAAEGRKTRVTITRLADPQGEGEDEEQ